MTMPTGYCTKQRKRVEIKDPRQVTLKNGRQAIQGTCPDRGATVFKITRGSVKLPDELLAAAGVGEGDELDVYVDDDGRVVLERTRVYDSGEDFLESIRARVGK
jgi:hypothetical protein